MNDSVRNLTPHAITVMSDGDDVVWTFPASGDVARLDVRYATTDTVGGSVPIGTLRYGHTTGLPDPVPGVTLLVSLLVKLANNDRHDLAVVADEVRDGAGRIIGCRGLATTVELGSR